MTLHEEFKARRRVLTVDRFRELLSYCPHTGEFRRQVDKPHSAAGTIAGRVDEFGYRHITIDYTRYKAHRLAWFVTHGVWPGPQVDHIDGNPANNSIANLRPVVAAENGQNRQGANKNSKSGLLGVVWHTAASKWMATISVDRKQRYLGLFPTAEQAHAAYLAAKRELHPFGNLTDDEEQNGMQSARRKGAHSTEQQTSDYVRHKRPQKAKATR